MTYRASDDRYRVMGYRRSGRSGIDLPAISLGLWQNFGGVDSFETGRAVLRRAFDRGVTHFDLANNYGPPFGSAEENFGRVLALDLAPQSLKRMGLDYVDVFYHHRPDPDTPLEETMGALAQVVRQGKALYVGISQYQPEDTRRAATILAGLGVPLLIHQPVYSMLNRWIEDGLLDTLEEIGAGCICFSPLAQGLLTEKYLSGVPADSRAARNRTLPQSRLTPELVGRLRQLDAIAAARGQSLAQMALAWVLRDDRITSALIGARSVEQLDNSLDALVNPDLSPDELDAIDAALA